jgi:O-antigen/teichoic acid export membrane protein
MVHKKLTIQSLHISVLVTIPVLLILLLLPNSIFTYVFGQEFSSIRTILLSLSIGILELSFFTVINHYFAGIGKNKVNIYGSLFGNIATITISDILIKLNVSDKLFLSNIQT